MKDQAKYVCAFRGRRDYYQVPLALAEAGSLDLFITDAYSGAVTRTLASILPSQIREKVCSREQPGIPRERVKCLWALTALEQLRHQLHCSPSLTFAKLDRKFSLAAAAQARKTGSDLYLYSPYAWEAFTARYRHDPRKVLFQFHPHPAVEHRILLEDRAKYGFIRQSFEEDAGEHLNRKMRQRSRDCWRHADLVVCASSFTKQSLLEAGASSSLCKIVPYGIDVSPGSIDAPASNQFSALFVGAGSQRKGLHHLLLAWRKAVLPRDSGLTLVCRHIDPGIEELARRTPKVRLLRGASRAVLTYFFRTSSVFIMPSLVEGFGQVYLEALAEGCPVVGTPHTGLPDLGAEADAIRQVQPGQIDHLISELELLSRRLPGDRKVRERARSCAMRWSWTRFRAGIRTTLYSTSRSQYESELGGGCITVTADEGVQQIRSE
jgi:glycosyltransferase involved in cell wall biosynthesis